MRYARTSGTFEGSKPRARRALLALGSAASAGLLLGSSAHATTGYWNGASSTWGTNTNWYTTASGTTAVAAAPGSADTAYFSYTGITSASQNVNLSGGQSVTGIVFLGTDTGGVILNNGTGTNTLTLGTGGITLNASTGAATFNMSTLAMGTSNQTWADNTTGSLLTINAALTGTNTLNISGGSSTSTTSSYIKAAGSVTGFTGTINVLTSYNSKFDIAGADAPTAAQVINVGNSSSSNATLYSTAALGSNVTINLYGSGNTEVLGTLRMDAGSVAGPVNIKTTGVTIGGNSGTTAYTGLITDSGNGFTKVGASTMALEYNGSNGISGPITITNGILQDYTPVGAARNELGVGLITIGTTTTGATLAFLGNYNPTTVTNNISIGGSGTDIIQTTGYNPVLSGTVSLSNNLTLASGGGGTTNLSVNGGISGTGNVTVSITGTNPSLVSIGSGGINAVGKLTYNAAAVNGTAADTTSGNNVITGVVGTNMSGLTLSLPSLAGQLTLSGANLYTSYTNISGGTLVAGIDSTSTTGPLGVGSAVYLANSATAGLNLNNHNVSIGSLTCSGSSGGNINLGSGTLTIGTNNASPAAYAGVISNAGGLTKVGSGTLILSGANTYTGATNINAGTLSLTNSNALSNTAVTVNSGGTLLVNGTSTIGSTSAGTLNVNGGAVDLRDGSINALNIPGTLTVGNSSTLDFELGSSNGSNDAINVTGASTVSGSNTINLVAPSLANGTTSYVLISSTGGGLITSASDFSIVGKPAGFASYQLSNPDDNTLLLTITANGTPNTAYWTGAASVTGGDTSNQWGYGGSLATLQTNWSSDQAGANDTLQIPGSITNVIFTAANAPGGALATTLDSNYSINSLTFDTSVATASIPSVGINTSTNTLQLGTGGLTINSTDNSTTTISGNGAVLIGASQTWANNSAEPLTISAPINGNVNSGTATVTIGGSGTGLITLSGNIGDGSAGGKLSVAFNPTGTLVVTGNNTNTGGDIVSNGTVLIGSNSALGTGIVGMGVSGSNNNASLLINGAYQVSNFIFESSPGSSGSLTIGGATTSTATFAGLIYASGSLNISQVTGGTLNISGGIGSNAGGSTVTFVGPGTTNVYGSAIADTSGKTSLVIAGGTENFSAASNYSGSTNVTGGVLNAGVSSTAATTGTGPFGLNSAVILANSASAQINLNNYNVSIGSLTGGGSSGGNINMGSGTLTVGGDNTSPAAYAGSLFGTGGLTKVGTGTLTLSGSNTYAGTTNINAGTLQINAASALPQNAIAFSGGTSSTLYLNGPITLSPTSLTFGVNNDNATISGAAGSSLNLNGSNVTFAPFNNSGSLTVNMSGLPAFNYNNNSGTFTINSGANSGTSPEIVTLAAANSIIASGFYIGNTGGGTGGATSTVYLGTGSNVIDAGSISIGASSGRSNGILQFNTGGGSLVIRGASGGSSASNLYIGQNYSYGGDTTAYGGTFNTTAGTLDAIFNTITLGNAISSTAEAGGNSVGRFQMGQGTMTATTANIGTISGSTAGSTGNYTGTGVLQLTGGTASIGTINLGVDSAPTGDNSLTLNSTINVNTGATLNATTIQAGTNTTGETKLTRTSSLNLSGGTLGNITGTNLNVSGTSLVLGSGGGTFNISTGQIGKISSVISGTGPLSIAGPGTVLLTSANTYSGATNISAGTLLAGGVNALSPNSAITVIGGTLDASGYNNSISALNVSSGSTINLGSGVILTDTGAAILSGTLNFIGTPTVSEVLMTYTGETGSFAATNLPNTESLSYTGGVLQIVSAGPANLTYLNANGTFDTGVSSSFNGSSGATVFHTGDNVTFDDTFAGPYTVSISGSVSPGTTTFNNSAGNYVVSGANGTSGISGSGSLTKYGTGSVTISTSNNYSGGTTVNAGSLILASAGAFATGPLTVASGANVTINTSSGGVFTPVVTTLSNAGTIDIKNNTIRIEGGNGSTGTIAAVTAQVQNAYNNGTWSVANSSLGAITSSTASADTTHLTTIGVATGFTTFEGQTVSSSDVLVKYTYYGDANLDGHVDGTDYSRIDNAVLNNSNSSNTQLTGWYNGDFDYDGVINGSDYTLIDNACNMQGAALAAEFASPSAVATAQIAGGTSAVPEPATLGLIGMGAIGLLGRRNRRRFAVR